MKHRDGSNRRRDLHREAVGSGQREGDHRGSAAQRRCGKAARRAAAAAEAGAAQARALALVAPAPQLARVLRVQVSDPTPLPRLLLLHEDGGDARRRERAAALEVPSRKRALDEPLN